MSCPISRSAEDSGCWPGWPRTSLVVTRRSIFTCWHSPTGQCVRCSSPMPTFECTSAATERSASSGYVRTVGADVIHIHTPEDRSMLASPERCAAYPSSRPSTA